MLVQFHILFMSLRVILVITYYNNTLLLLYISKVKSSIANMLIHV